MGKGRFQIKEPPCGGFGNETYFATNNITEQYLID
jgi:hypothetical protein